MLKSIETNALQLLNKEFADVRLLVFQLLKFTVLREVQSLNKEFADVRLLVFQLLKSIETNALQPLNKLSALLRLLVSNELKSNETNALQLLNIFITSTNFILFVLLNFIDVIWEVPLNIWFVDIPVKSRLDKSTEVTAP